MTNNIEKLYELAKATKYRAVSIYNPIIGYGDYETIEEASSYGDGFKVEKVNSKFTDTKQLKLIKWFDYFSYFSTGGDFHMQCHLKDKQYHKIRFVSFEDTLASLVCNLWEDLTPEQKEEVRGILQ